MHTYDDNEAYDATDHGADVVPDGLFADLFAEQLAELEAAGF